MQFTKKTLLAPILGSFLPGIVPRRNFPLDGGKASTSWDCQEHMPVEVPFDADVGIEQAPASVLKPILITSYKNSLGACRTAKRPQAAEIVTPLAPSGSVRWAGHHSQRFLPDPQTSQGQQLLVNSVDHLPAAPS
ncbi:hypothetical protein C8R45DRAFT_1071487 [Mycena sanguinolenta]|nr:hypothetical protein C8R45DRAFT_1071487 [Mycena sanguinolenta]